MVKQITLTSKVRIYPTKAQEVKLLKTLEVYKNGLNLVSRWAYLTMSVDRPLMHKENYSKLREDIPSQMSCSIMRDVISTYKTIHAKNTRWSIEAKFNRSTPTLVWNRDYSISKKTNDLSIITVDGREIIKTNWSGLLHEGEFGSAKLIHRRGKWYIQIPITFEIDDSNISNIVGVDLGLRFVITSYDSHGKTKFVNGKQIKQKKNHYKKVRSQLQSKNTKSSRRRLKTIGQRESRWMNDVNHCLSKALVLNNPNSLFVLEDLSGIRKIKTSKKMRGNLHSWSFYDLRQKIEYKSLLYGCETLIVDPHYTSQTCPKCGNIDKKNRSKEIHLFTCTSCRYQSNDDRIGAMNLFNIGLNNTVDVNTVALEQAPQQGVQSTTLNVPVV